MSGAYTALHARYLDLNEELTLATLVAEHGGVGGKCASREHWFSLQGKRAAPHRGDIKCTERELIGGSKGTAGAGTTTGD